MRGYATRREKTLRAFGVYVEIMDTAAWLRSWMLGPFRLHDLTPQGFRLLILLYEEGPTKMMDAAKRLRFQRQNLDTSLRRLEERGWVRRMMVELEKKPVPKGWKGRLVRQPKRRWGVGVMELTPEGEKFVARVFPRHAKVVKALMRALHGKEQRSLVELCRKLRAGAILKFMSEITHLDEWEEKHYEREEVKEAKENTLSRLLQVGTRVEEVKERHEIEDVEENQKLLKGIVAKMRRYNTLKEARNVDWNKPPDETRYATNAVEMLMRVASDAERKLLERLRKKMSCVEVIGMLKEAAGDGAVARG